MSSGPAYDDRVIEALEACRPGSDDLASLDLELKAILASDGGLQELHQRLQRVDSYLVTAVHEVSVPAGLQERILARLAAEHDRSPLLSTIRVRRRWWIATSGIAAVAACLFMAFWLGLPGEPPRDEAGVLSAVVQQFLTEVDSETSSGLLLSEQEPPAPYRMSRAVARVPELRWRVVQELVGYPAVAYDFPGPSNRRATLYVLNVIPSEIAFTRPTKDPMRSTGGLSASIWREEGRLFVLVVRGDASAYRRLIYAPSGPLT